MLSVYEHGKYDIYAIDQPGALAGQAPAPIVAGGPTPAELPPANRVHEQLAGLLAQPSEGLPERGGAVVPYHTHLSLDQVSQPSVGAGADRFGTYVADGLSFQWSDMLGNQNLFTSVQTGSYVGGGFSDVLNNTAAAVGYENLGHRWTWGGIVQQFPYFAGGFTNDILVDNGGVPAVVQQTTLLRQINRGVSAITAYPFNPVRLVEFSGGYQHVTFDQVVQTDVYDYVSGALLDSTTDTTAIAGGLNLGTTSAAFVYDNAVFGATSPIDGQRSRFEVSPTMGSLFFTGVTADYRRYFMPAKLYTIATRVMHYGRYGRDAEDGRLLPLFIGYPELVRGYDIGSFNASECVPDAADPCPAFDRLLGSRALIANLEFRFPLLRPFGLRERVYGAVPVEVALFTDAGVAWDSHVTPAIFGGSRQGVVSSGVAFRVNAFGYAVVQFDVAHPFQRPGKGWVFQFSLSPGF